MTYRYQIERVGRYAKNNIQTGVKDVYFLDFFRLVSFTFTNTHDISNLDINELHKIKTNQETSLSIGEGVASLSISIEGLEQTTQLNNLIKNKNIGCFAVLENKQCVFLGYIIDKTKPFLRYKKGRLNAKREGATASSGDTSNTTANKITYTFEYPNQDLIFYTGDLLKLDVLNLALPYAKIVQVTPNTLNNVTITGLKYIERDGVVTQSGNISNSTIDIGDVNVFYGNITEFICHVNSISDLDVSNATDLTKLYCYANPLNILNVARLVKLIDLRCYSTSITALDVSLLVNLVSLYCHSNSIEVLDVSALIKLTTLNCGDNLIEILDVSALTKMVNLICYTNLIENLDVSALTKLVQLNCAGNLISTIDISNCNLLTSVYLNSNDLRTEQLDLVLQNLVTHGKTNGILNIANNAGTYTDTTSYNTLISRGWTITT